MGRGRAKAKQTKVARELKYSSRGTDLDALRAELSGAQQRPGEAADGDGADDEDDPYADRYLDDDEDDLED
jgi:hypothetical protein